MPKKRPPLVTNEIYHVVVRGVGNTEIFHDDQDRFRAIFSLFEFNDSNSARIRERREARLAAKRAGNEDFSAERECLVEVMAFCFMSNHIHLLLRQLVHGGITDFMRKFGTGYALYYNIKYERKGHLFQSRFHAVLVSSNEQLQAVFSYIHTNPVSLVEPSWKENGIRDPQATKRFLEEFRWSSYLDYLGIKNFPSVTERDFLTKVMGGNSGCRAFVRNYIDYKHKAGAFNELFIE